MLLASITSKRQLTIPVAIFNKIGLAAGDKLIIEEKNGVLQLTPAESLVESLAGSVSVSPKLRKIDPDRAITEAKKRRFAQKQ